MTLCMIFSICLETCNINTSSSYQYLTADKTLIFNPLILIENCSYEIDGMNLTRQTNTKIPILVSNGGKLVLKNSLISVRGNSKDISYDMYCLRSVISVIGCNSTLELNNVTILSYREGTNGVCSYEGRVIIKDSSINTYRISSFGLMSSNKASFDVESSKIYTYSARSAATAYDTLSSKINIVSTKIYTRKALVSNFTNLKSFLEYYTDQDYVNNYNNGTSDDDSDTVDKLYRPKGIGLYTMSIITTLMVLTAAAVNTHLVKNFKPSISKRTEQILENL